jgi:mannose-6-phosphate isomerase-like protein (cupin superfamily)
MPIADADIRTSSMQIVEAEIANNKPVPATQDPDYQDHNPIIRVMTAWAKAELAADREHYTAGTLNFLFPYRDLALYGPKPPNSAVLDPRSQDEKQDFQKQNIADFKLEDCWLARGFAAAGEWDGSFLKLSYSAGPFTRLAEKARAAGRGLGPSIRAWIKVGSTATNGTIVVPYNSRTDRYEIELWAYPNGDLRDRLGEKGQAALDDGVIVADTNLVRGHRDAFLGPAFTAERDQANRKIAETNNPAPLDMINRATDHTMHPVLPLRVEVSWADHTGQVWDNNGGSNYAYEFNMLFRGWRNYLQVGQSRHPHGGVGFLEYRNLLSNYFGLEAKRQSVLGDRWAPELGRELNTWNFDAQAWDGNQARGPKPSGPKLERFLAVDYMDLHLLNARCGIGVHRHRDNQEVFLLLEGSALMLVGDWCRFPGRERAFELRQMEPGDMTICKTGQLHALYNHTDEQIKLFMFGGYD